MGHCGIPILNPSDVQDYLVWRNARAAAASEPWRYDLPSEQQWEKAARGVDGRVFPWGDRFDLSLTVNHYRRPDWLLDAPRGFEPCDQSPFGVRDVAGSREEWTRDGVTFGAEPTYVKRGGHWGTALASAFRVANAVEAGATRAQSTQGLRLVARPAE